MGETVTRWGRHAGGQRPRVTQGEAGTGRQVDHALIHEWVPSVHQGQEWGAPAGKRALVTGDTREGGG